MMNVHHLELFYYVARHGGVSAAARAMPYGIQQPAISAQILQLEDGLGVQLYRRRPFELTSQGRVLYEFIAPFFGGLSQVADLVRGGRDTHLRIAASEVVQRDYLPELLRRMRERVSGFHFTLSHGTQERIEASLAAQEIDIGLSTLTERPGAGIKSRELLRLPMILLVGEKSRLTRANQILEQERIEIPLITLNANDAVARSFQQELRRRQIEWIASLEVGSSDLVLRYVAEGFGIGLMLEHPRLRLPKGVRALRLDGFPPIRFGALWTGKLTLLSVTFLEQAAEFAGQVLASETGR